MPDSSNHNPGDRFAGLRDLQRRERERRPARSGRPLPAERREGPLQAPATSAGSAADRLAHLRVPGRHRWTRRTLITVNILVALCLVAGVAAFGYVEYRLGQIKRIALPGLSESHSSAFTLLVVGSDTRNLGKGGSSNFGSQSQTPGQRSDTVMLLRIVPSTRKITILSIPRDLWVHIDGIGYSKINTAFDTGPELLITTIQHDLGIPINHFVEVNFDSFRQITDAVGGVKFWFPTPAMDAYSNLSVPKAGCVNLTGNQALGFVRSRHYEYYENGQWNFQGLSDLARIQRQQDFVKKMLKKAEGKFTNPIALNDIIGAVASNLTVDRGFGTSLMIGLAEDFRSADVSGIPTETLPTNNYYVDGQDALSLQQPAAQRMITSFDQLGTPEQAKPAPPAPVVPSKERVEVANGSGVNDQAAKAAAAIGTLGWRTTVTASSPASNLGTDEIEYAPDSLRAAELLASHLAGRSSLVVNANLTPTPYNLELITGRSYAGLGRGAGVVAAVPPTARVPWLLPGPEPTEAELASC